MDHVVITGATCAVGVALTEICLEKGCLVTALVREDSPHRDRLPRSDRLRLASRGLSDLNDLEANELGNCDVFYHLAWTDTDRDGRYDVGRQHKNIQYTLDALALARRLGCRKFVGAGSQAEYGVRKGMMEPDSPVDPCFAYAVCKYAAGRLASLQAKQYGMDFFWVRICSIYGKYDLPGTMISSALAKMRKGEHCPFTPGTHLWDYLYSDDAGKAFYLIGERAAGNKVYCLASGTSRPLREYVEQMRDVACPGLELGMGEIPYDEDNHRDICVDITSLCRDTGWRPETDFKSGIEKLLT